jgi:predicted RNA-binding protein (virulence factor B family)
MLALGDYNELEVARAVDFGLYLTSDDGDLLLPGKYVPEGTQIGDKLRVFVYRDSEDRLIATTLEPLAKVDEFAALTVRDVSEVGAFLDWGLEKDLLLPYRNQRRALRPGDRATVYVYLDDTSDRIVANAKWERYLPEADLPFPGQPGDAVQLFVAENTDLGFSVIVNGTHVGLLYHNEVFRPLRLGDTPTGYLRQIRPDGKLDISLQKAGYDEALDAADALLATLRQAGGTLPLSDKSEPDDIYRRLGISKKVFKKALGTLYKRGLVQLLPTETRLTSEE